MPRDWTADQEAYDEARMDRFMDDPREDPVVPQDVLTDRELEEYYGLTPGWLRRRNG